MKEFGPLLPSTTVKIRRADQDLRLQKSGEGRHEHRLIVSSEYGKCFRQVSKDLKDSICRENLKDIEWYFEKFSTYDSFEGARARSIESEIHQHGKALIDDLIPTQVLPGIARRGHVQIQVLDADTEIQDFYWEILEDCDLWESPNEGKPRTVNVVRVRNFVSQEVKKPRDSKIRRVIVVTARLSTADIPHRLISRAIHKGIDGSNSKLDIVRPGSFEALKACLENTSRDIQRSGILHLDLHGTLDANNEAILIFVKHDKNGISRPDPVQGKDLVDLITKFGIQTVVLNACRSAAGNGQSSSLARQFIDAGVQIAIGMRYNVLSHSAQVFMEHFYRQLVVCQRSASGAAAIARSALRKASSRSGRFGQVVSLHDFVVPIVHCHHDSSLEIEVEANEVGATSEERDELPFYGREGDILELESIVAQLTSPPIINLSGQPGVGKTTFLNEVSRWWLSSNMVDRAVTVSLQERHADSLVDWSVDQFEQEIGGIDITQKTLIVFDDIDLLSWTSIQPARQLRRYFRSLPNCILLFSSRNPVPWVKSMAVDMLLQNLSFSATISIANHMVRNQGGERFFPNSHEDRAYFEFMCENITRGNPLAIQILLWHLAHLFLDNKESTMRGAFNAFLRQEPIFLAPVMFEDFTQSRAVFELMKLFKNVDIIRGSELDQEYRSMVWQLGKIKRSSFESYPVLKPTQDELLRLSIGAFCNIVPANLEPSATSCWSFQIHRKVNKVDENALKALYRQSRQAAEKGISLSQQYLSRMDNHSTKNKFETMLDENHAELTNFLVEDLREFRSEKTTHIYGKGEAFQWTFEFYELNPLVTLVSRSFNHRAAAPESYQEEMVSSLLAYFHKHEAAWDRLDDLRPTEPGGKGLSEDLNDNFMNYISLLSSSYKLSPGMYKEWAFVPFLSLSIADDERRKRVVANIQKDFAIFAATHVENFKSQLFAHNLPSEMEKSQNDHFNEWMVATSLELFGLRSAAGSLPLAIECALPIDEFDKILKIFENKPLLPHLDEMKRHNRSFQAVLKQSQLDLRMALSTSCTVDPTEILQTYKELKEAINAEYTNNPLTDSIDETETLGQQFLAMWNPESDMRRMNYGVDKRLAHVMFDQLTEKKLSSAEAIQKLEKLLEEEVEGSNEPRSRVMLHRNLADMHIQAGNFDAASMHSKREQALLQSLDKHSREVYTQISNKWQHLVTNELAKVVPKKDIPSKISDALDGLFKDKSWRNITSSENELGQKILEMHLQRLSEEPSKETEGYVDRLNQIGTTLQMRGRFEESIPYFREVVDRRRRTLPLDHDNILIPMVSLAKAHRTIETRREGIKLFRIVQQQLERRTSSNDSLLGNQGGKDHLLARVKGSLGLFLLQYVNEQTGLSHEEHQDLLTEAEECMRSSYRYHTEAARSGYFFENTDIGNEFVECGLNPEIEIYRKDYAITALNLAYLCECLSKYEESEQLYVECIGIIRGYTRDASDSQLLSAKSNLAQLYEKIGRLDEAEELFLEAQRTSVELLGSRHPDSITYITNLLIFYSQQGKEMEADAVVLQFRDELTEAGSLWEDNGKTYIGFNPPRYPSEV